MTTELCGTNRRLFDGGEGAGEGFDTPYIGIILCTRAYITRLSFVDLLQCVRMYMESEEVQRREMIARDTLAIYICSFVNFDIVSGPKNSTHKGLRSFVIVVEKYVRFLQRVLMLYVASKTLRTVDLMKNTKAKTKYANVQFRAVYRETETKKKSCCFRSI